MAKNQLGKNYIDGLNIKVNLVICLFGNRLNQITKSTINQIKK